MMFLCVLHQIVQMVFESQYDDEIDKNNFLMSRDLISTKTN